MPDAGRDTLCDAHPRGQARPVCDLGAGHGGDHYSIADDARWPDAERAVRCVWSANRMPHTAHGRCAGFLPHLAEGLQRLMDHQAHVLPPGGGSDA